MVLQSGKETYRTSICKALTPRHGVLSLSSLYRFNIWEMRSKLKTVGYVYQENSGTLVSKIKRETLQQAFLCARDDG